MWDARQAKEFAKLMLALTENYGRDYSDSLVKIWIKALQEFPYEQVEEAIVKHMATSNKFPTLADVVNKLRGVSGWRDLEAMAEKAFVEAKNAAEKYGAYASVRFRDPVINTVLHELGGWEKFCLVEFDAPEGATYRKQFIHLYCYYVNQGKVKRVDYLPGIVEGHNASHGYELPDIVEVGDSRNDKLALYEAENSVLLGEGRNVKKPLPPKPMKALPKKKEEPAVSPEEAMKYIEQLKEITSRIGKPMPADEKEIN